jgi:hypothetical protein
MPTFPYLYLESLTPRRVFVPFQKLNNDDAEKLWKEARDDWNRRKSREIAVFIQTPAPGAKGPDEFAVHAVRIPANGRLEFELWQHGLSFWRPTGNGAIERIPESSTQVLDLAIGLKGAGELGLFVTWNPGGADFRHVFLGPGDSVHLANSAKPDDAVAREKAATYCEAAQGEPFIVLDIPVVAVLPDSLATKIYGDTLPDRMPGNWIDSIRMIFQPVPKIDWQFSSPRLHLAASPIQRTTPGFGIALDFGTSASTVAVFPTIQPSMPSADRVADPLPNLAPWPHVTDVIQAKSLASDSLVAVAVPTPFDGECPDYPFFMDSRKALPSNRSQVPSILHAPNFLRGSRLDRELVTADAPQCFIGEEVRKLVEEALPYEPSDKSARADWDRYLYSPKSLVGRASPQAAILDHIERPIEVFLREMLDQAYATAVMGRTDQSRVKGALQSVTYSYPVTWTDFQRDCFHSHLKSAISKSLLAECVPEGRLDEIVSKKAAMDEASAAFLGFIMKRFSGLEGRELLHAYQPFQPDGGVPAAQLSAVNVLVFDCGEGTTDIVWLEIAPALDQAGGSPHLVDSRVKRHFATEQAGLEVTRRIAQYVKDILLQQNPENADRVRKWICTKLEDKGILKRHDPAIGATLGAHRMGLVHLFYRLAEELKIQGALAGNTRDIATQRLRAAVKNFPELDLPEDKLRKVVREVFADAVDQVRNWFKDGPRLDVVIMSGRSCRLPELATMLREAIPPQCRPFAMDFVTPATFLLEPSSDDANGDDQVGKNCVVTGLVLNRYILESPTGESLRCHPIDSLKRTRAIGVQQQGTTADRKTVFSSMFPLLVEADNGPINAEEDLGPLVLKKGATLNVPLAINFAGKKVSDSDNVDPVHPFLDIELGGGSDDLFDALHLYFRQKSSTDLRLSKIELHKDGASPQVKTVSESEAWKTITVGRVKVTCKPCPTDSDFRNTGRIHIHNDDAIDL